MSIIGTVVALEARHVVRGESIRLEDVECRIDSSSARWGQALPIPTLVENACTTAEMVYANLSEVGYGGFVIPC